MFNWHNEYWTWATTTNRQKQRENTPKELSSFEPVVFYDRSMRLRIQTGNIDYIENKEQWRYTHTYFCMCRILQLASPAIKTKYKSVANKNQPRGLSIATTNVIPLQTYIFAHCFVHEKEKESNGKSEICESQRLLQPLYTYIVYIAFSQLYFILFAKFQFLCVRLYEWHARMTPGFLRKSIFVNSLHLHYYE